MNEEQISRIVAEVHNLSYAKSRKIIKTFIGLISEILPQEEVRIMNFGKFEVMLHKGNGKVPPTKIPKFRASRRLKDAVK